MLLTAILLYLKDCWSWAVVLSTTAVWASRNCEWYFSKCNLRSAAVCELSIAFRLKLSMACCRRLQVIHKKRFIVCRRIVTRLWRNPSARQQHLYRVPFYGSKNITTRWMLAGMNYRQFNRTAAIKHSLTVCAGQPSMSIGKWWWRYHNMWSIIEIRT